MPKESKFTVTMIEVVGELHRESPKAYLFYDGAGLVWVPKSQCKWEPDPNAAPKTGPKPGSMHVPEWIAKEKGMI
jgi:hypothetical protein